MSLKELKDQLQEVVGTRFLFGRVVSPWGAPVLFVKKKTALNIFPRLIYDRLPSLLVKEHDNSKILFVTRMVNMNSGYAFWSSRAPTVFIGLDEQEQEEHAHHCSTNFTTEEIICAIFTKCVFWLSNVHFCVTLFQQKGITMYPAKVEAITNGQDRLPVTEVLVEYSDAAGKVIANASTTTKPYEIKNSKDDETHGQFFRIYDQSENRSFRVDDDGILMAGLPRDSEEPMLSWVVVRSRLTKIGNIFFPILKDYNR
ncbi:hypothetical protein Tco_1153498 [Tanacetum coccineum]